MTLVAGFVLLAMVSCKSGGDPKETVQHFFTALKDKKFDEAKKYATKESQSLLDMISSLAQKMPDSTSADKAKEEKFDVTNVKINGDAATADVVPNDKSAALTVNLKKEEGQWKVAFDKSSLMKMSLDQAQKQGVDVQKEVTGAFDSLKSAADQGSRALDSLSKAVDSLKK